MASSIAGFDFPTYDFQQQSPLFGVLPPEIRNEVFSLALIQYDDESAAYPENSYWYRPGFKAPKKSSASLLRTCKLAYLEGQKVYLRELEWAFWFDRGPQGHSGIRACSGFFNSLTESNVRDLTSVRFFTQMYWLEQGHELRSICNHPKFRPTHLTITIRYSDWWYWESNNPLSMDENWLRRFVGPPSLRELRIEYETLTWKKSQMDRIIERNKKWKLRVADGGHLSAADTQLNEWRWRGTSNLDGKVWSHHGSESTVEYVVVTDTWAYVDGPIDEGAATNLAIHQGSESEEVETDEEYDIADYGSGDDFEDEDEEEHGDDA